MPPHGGKEPSASSAKARTRSGCWNCRRRKKKCMMLGFDVRLVPELITSPGDEKRPICTGCSVRGDVCERGAKLSFRQENIQLLPATHPSMRCGGRHDQNVKFKVCKVLLSRSKQINPELIDHGYHPRGHSRLLGRAGR